MRASASSHTVLLSWSFTCVSAEFVCFFFYFPSAGDYGEKRVKKRHACTSTTGLLTEASRRRCTRGKLSSIHAAAAATTGMNRISWKYINLLPYQRAIRQECRTDETHCTLCTELLDWPVIVPRSNYVNWPRLNRAAFFFVAYRYNLTPQNNSDWKI